MPDVTVNPYIDENQLVLPGLGPVEGERYVNVNTGTIVAVLKVDQRKAGWVTLRVHGEQQTITVASFERTFRPLANPNRSETR